MRTNLLGRSTRRNSGNRRLMVESLERRELLSAAPMMEIPLGATVRTMEVPVQDIHQGDQGIVLGRYIFYQDGLSVQATAIAVYPEQFGAGLSDVFDTLELWVDRRRDIPGVDTMVERKAVSHDVVVFEGLERLIANPQGKPLAEIRGNAVPYFDAVLGENPTVGVEVEVEFKDLRGSKVMPWDVAYVCPTTMHNIVVPQAELSVSLLSESAEVQVGETAYYAVGVANNGPDMAEGVRIVVPIPAGTTFDQAHSTATWVQRGDQLVSTTTAISPQMSTGTTVAFKTEVPGQITVSVSAYSPIMDPNPANNGATVQTTVVAPQLYVTEQAGPSADTAVKYQKNITIERFEAYAYGADELLTLVAITALEGDLRNGVGYDLVADTDGDLLPDTIVQANVAAQNGQVRFDNLTGGGYVVPEESVVRFEVRADVAAAFVSSPATLRTQIFEVQGERTSNGSSVDFNFTPCDQTLWTFVSNGDLTVAEDTTPVRTHQLLGGTGGVAVARAALSATLEDADVYYIGIHGDGQLRSIDRVALMLPGLNHPIGYATRASAEPDDNFGARFTNQELVVAEGQQEVLLICPDILTDINGGQSNDWFALELSAVMARGVTSSNNLQPVFNGPVVGPWQTVVMSKLSAFENAGPVEAVLHAGMTEIFQIGITAAVNNNWRDGVNVAVIDALMPTVSIVNASIDASSFRVYNRIDPSQWVAAILMTTDGTVVTGTVGTGVYLVKADGLSGSIVNTRIGSGQRIEIVFAANVIDTRVDETLVSFVQASLTDFADPSKISFGARGSHLQWRDTDAATAIDEYFADFRDTSVNGTFLRG